MNQLFKLTLIFIATMIVVHSTHAWNIGAKTRVNGPTIHITYFLTPDNGSIPVHATAHLGTLVNGICTDIANNAVYDLGSETIRTGDMIDVDAFMLKSVIGINPNINCMSVYYQYSQLVIETFQLYSDGFNYVNTVPATSEVTIL